MDRLTTKKWFEHYMPDKETTTLCVDDYITIIESSDLPYDTSRYYLVGEAVEKLAYYEDLEKQLESVYGECDELLEKTVEHLVKHEGIEIGSPFKARLLTDEDVDKWQEYKQLEEQNLLLKLPCKVGTPVWTIVCGITGKNPSLFRQDFEIAMIQYWGTSVFLTKEDAEEALRKKVE